MGHYHFIELTSASGSKQSCGRRNADIFRLVCHTGLVLVIPQTCNLAEAPDIQNGVAESLSDRIGTRTEESQKQMSVCYPALWTPVRI